MFGRHCERVDLEQREYTVVAAVEGAADDICLDLDVVEDDERQLDNLSDRYCN